MSKSPKGINLNYKEEERVEDRISYSVMMAIREDAVFHRVTAPSEGIWKHSVTDKTSKCQQR